MVLALLVLTGLIVLGSLTVLSVQGGIATSGHDRFQAIALYAAESGAAAGVDFMRRNYQGETGKWSNFTRLRNENAVHPPGIPGNQVRPGQDGNLFSPGLQAWYDVEIRNNDSDPGLNSNGSDEDATVVVRSTGYGPNGTIAQVEWEIRAPGSGPGGRPCPSYGQRGMAEDGAGRNDCLQNVGGNVQTYRPGDQP